MVEGVAGTEWVDADMACGITCLRPSSSDPKQLIPLSGTSRETTLALAAAHALVLLDDGTVVGDPMEKTTLAAMDWKLSKGPSEIPRFVEEFLDLTTQVTTSPRMRKMLLIVLKSTSDGGTNSRQP